MSKITAQMLKAAKAELQRREERAALKADCEKDLMAFVEAFWPVVEPATPLIKGWVLEAMCDVLMAAADGHLNRICINVPPGSMKALDIETPVMTTWGWKRHGDLRPGDFVFGPDGSPRRVLAVTGHKMEPAYDVSFDDRSVLRAGAGHLWSVEREHPYGGARGRRVRKAAVVSTGGLFTSAMAASSPQRPDRIPLHAPIQMRPADLLVDPYILGAWLGDGASESAMLCIGHEDIEHFSQLGEISRVFDAVKGRRAKFYRIRLPEVQTKLRVLGLLKNKHVPDAYLEASIDQRWELLRGLMDTDGTTTDEGRCVITTKHERMGRQIHQLVSSLGMKATLRSHFVRQRGKTLGPYHDVAFSSLDGGVIFKLPRKQKRLEMASKRSERLKHRYVEHVSEAGECLINCIQVEGGVYLAGKSFVTTHNSTMLNVFYPAWLWGAQNKPHLRFISASYSTMIPERDNGRLLRVIQSDLFRQFWGDRVQVVREGVGLVETSATGWKRVVSTGGGTTGHRGDYVLCLERSARILTSQGEMAVGDIVDERREVLVAGWSGAGVRWQRIECYEINPPGRMVRISYAGRSLVCTVDHPIWIEGRGFVRADHVRQGDVLKGMSHLLDARDGLTEVLQQGLLREASSTEARGGYGVVRNLRERVLQAARTYGASRNRGDVQPGVLAFEQQRGEQPSVRWGERPGNLSSLRQGHPAQSVRGNAGHGLLNVLCPQNELGGCRQSVDAQAMPGLRSVLLSAAQGIKILFAEMRGSRPCQENGRQREWPVRRWAQGACDRVGDGASERSGASLRSLWGGISAKVQNVAVLRPVVSACRAWGESLRAKERALGSWPGKLWVPAGMDGSVSRIHPPARREPVPTLQYDRAPAWESVAGASHRLPEGKSRHIEPDYGLPLLSWADARTAGGQGKVEGVAVRSVEFIGDTGEPTYNLRVGPDHNYFVEGILAHNCDDLNDPNNVESETIRAGTSHWLREVMPDRVNNLKTSVIINIQQRTHEQDATGVLLQFGYTHIVVPMEFDPARFQHVVLRRNKGGEATQVWADPRGLDEDGNELEGLVEKAHGGLEAEPGSPMAQAEGLLCWPERYPPDEMEKMRNIKGPYAWAAQYLQLPTVRGGAIIRREWWRRWRGLILPEFGTTIASLDTAIKEGTENDYNALTILGAFADDEGAPQFMLADAWRIRTNLADLVRMVGDSCRKHNVDYLLIEDKARGHDVAAEIRRLYASSPWDTLLLKIGGGRYAQDKVTRVMAVTPMFSGPVRKDPATGLDLWDGGMFWAPETDWAEEVIAETTSFPRGAHDDYCDCLAQAALWARKTGLAITKAEYRETEDEAMQYQRPVGVPYAIHGPVDA